MGVNGPFAGEVSGIEFFEGGANVVGIELDGAAATSLLSASISTMPTTSAMTSPGGEPRIEVGEANERKALPAGRDDGQRKALDPTSATARMLVIWAARPFKTHRRLQPDGDRGVQSRRP